MDPLDNRFPTLVTAFFRCTNQSSSITQRDAKQVEWIQSFYQIFKQLRDYVKQYFANGIPWNPTGEPAASVLKALDPASSSAPAPPTAGGPPAPPPPPPPGPAPVLDIKTEPAAPAAASASGGLGAVFSELNKGDAVTKGLRKVDKSEMTHKNPALRTKTDIPSDRPRSPAPGKKPKPESMRMKKPSKKELEGNKWTIVRFSTHASCFRILFPVFQTWGKAIYNEHWLTFSFFHSYRKTLKRNRRPSRLTLPSTTPSSSAAATTQPSLSAAKPTRSQWKTRTASHSSSTRSCRPSTLSRRRISPCR